MAKTLELNAKGSFDSAQDKETGCCPRFDPKPWDGKVLEWDKKKFVKDHVKTFFYMPINFGKIIVPIVKKMEEAKAEPDVALCLSDHTSKWNMDIYVAVSKEIEGLENVTLSGKFLSKVYEGPFKDTGKWCKDFEVYAKEKGYKVKPSTGTTSSQQSDSGQGKWYMSYTTCPACAKAYGKNYVIIIAKLE